MSKYTDSVLRMICSNNSTKMLPSAPVLAPIILLMSMAFVVIMAPERSGAVPSSKEIRVLCWALGGKLSLATLFYFRGQQYEKELKEAQDQARMLDIQIKPLPPRSTKSDVHGDAEALRYFADGDGNRLGDDIRLTYGETNAILYVIATKIFLLSVVYDLEPAEADRIVPVIRNNMNRVKMPESMWRPVLDAVARRATYEDVRAAVFKMYRDVGNYLINE